MILRMKSKTTLVLSDHLMRELKRRAAERGETLSAIVEETLQRGLAPSASDRALRPMKTYAMGRPRVDLADRDRLYRAMEDE